MDTSWLFNKCLKAALIILLSLRWIILIKLTISLGVLSLFIAPFVSKAYFKNSSIV